MKYEICENNDDLTDNSSINRYLLPAQNWLRAQGSGLRAKGRNFVPSTLSLPISSSPISSSPISSSPLLPISPSFLIASGLPEQYIPPRFPEIPEIGIERMLVIRIKILQFGSLDLFQVPWHISIEGRYQSGLIFYPLSPGPPFYKARNNAC